MARPEAQSKPALVDPLPERRLARLLAAFIAAGLFFLVFPGTLAGVWALVQISFHQRTEAISKVWSQAHGHAQLFGWTGAFMIGISLYTLPKFHGAWIRSLAVGWAMFALWTGALAARWAAAVWDWHWPVVGPVTAVAELAVALLAIWQCSASGPGGRRPDLWERIILAGFAGLAVALGLHLALVWRALPERLIPPGPNGLLLYLALWAFCFPVAWGFSARFLPGLIGLDRPREKSARLGVDLLVAGAVVTAIGWSTAGAALTAVAVAAACWSLGIFARSLRPPKVTGVDPRYPWFTRAAYGWLAVAALLALGSTWPGMGGASRHAFTVGFLGTLILALGPRILPSFLNSRELWSRRLMLVSLPLLTIGCALRVTAQPLAYGGVLQAAWHVLPVSAALELTAILLFAVNIGVTLALPMPAWIAPKYVTENLNLYWCVNSYPETRPLLEKAGLALVRRPREIPRALTLREAAEAAGLGPEPLVALLRRYFDRRLARALRR